MKVKGTEVTEVSSPFNDNDGFRAMMSQALGSISADFENRALIWLMNAAKARTRDVTQEEVNAALAFMDAVRPRDEFEAALAIQMFAAHDLSIEMMVRAKQSDDRRAMNEYGNLATKFARTFTAQVEALGKLRRGGEQVVRHIHVDNRGGQAVIAETVNSGGAGNGNSADQCHATALPSAGTALHCPDPLGDRMPLAGSQRQAAMSYARGYESGGVEGQ